MRTAFVEKLIEAADGNSDIFIVNGDLGFNVLEPFVEKYPDRHVNLGLTEQNMVGFAAGMALSGKLPVVYSIATFATLKTIEQLRNDVCYQGLKVKLVGVGSGLTYSQFGATHHAVEDIALMRILPGMKIICPGDPVEAAEATQAMLADSSPNYLRIGSRGEPKLHSGKIDFQIGRGIVMQKGEKVALVATGNLLANTVAAAEILAKTGVTPTVVSMHTVKPLDRELLTELFDSHEHVFTVEEHSRIGGLGSAASELYAEMGENQSRLHVIALPDEFQKLGYWLDEMRDKNGLSPERIAERVRKVL